ncbi:unnamed protein product, partial [Scytosiphon promiscuus]
VGEDRRRQASRAGAPRVAVGGPRRPRVRVPDRRVRPRARRRDDAPGRAQPDGGPRPRTDQPPRGEGVRLAASEAQAAAAATAAAVQATVGPRRGARHAGPPQHRCPPARRAPGGR